MAERFRGGGGRRRRRTRAPADSNAIGRRAARQIHETSRPCRRPTARRPDDLGQSAEQADPRCWGGPCVRCSRRRWPEPRHRQGCRFQRAKGRSRVSWCGRSAFAFLVLRPGKSSPNGRIGRDRTCTSPIRRLAIQWSPPELRAPIVPWGAAHPVVPRRRPFMRVALRPGGGASRQRVQRAGLGPPCGLGPQGGCGSGRRRATWGLEPGRVRRACVACLYLWRGP